MFSECYIFVLSILFLLIVHFVLKNIMVQRNVSHTIVLKDCLQQCLQDAKVNSTQDKGNADKDNSNNEVKEEFTVTGNCKSNNNVLI